jgi:serine/threonine protein kinase
VKLIDFEIAQQTGGTTTSTAGNIRGSFDYMAPDFTDADFHGDVKSDVF